MIGISVSRMVSIMVGNILVMVLMMFVSVLLLLMKLSYGYCLSNVFICDSEVV